MELWAGKSVNEESVRKDMELLLEAVKVVSMSERIAKRAGEIRRGEQVGAMDAIIAATALEEGAKVATLNEKDFKRVEGLQLWES